MKRWMVAGAAVLAGWATVAPWVAQSVAKPAAAPMVAVVMTTSAGTIRLDLDRDHAPATVANFLRYVDGKRLDGTTFYRAAHLGEGTGLVQGGIKDDPRRRLPPVRHEATDATGLAHVDGAIAMARGRPGSAAGDFFVILGTVPYLDARPGDPGYAVFGRVTEGMDVVRRIWDGRRSATAGVAATKGEMLAVPVRILSVRRAR